MKKQFLFSISLFLLAGIAYAQPKQKPVVKQAIPALKKLLSGTSLPYKIINDSLAIIPYEGENISSCNVVVQGVNDLYIIYTNLTEALPAKIDDTKYKYLLQRNDYFDIVKLAMSEEANAVYVRADFYKTVVTPVLLTRIIKQVANVTNIIGGDLK